MDTLLFAILIVVAATVAIMVISVIMKYNDPYGWPRYCRTLIASEESILSGDK